MVAITVVLAAVLYVMVSGLLTPVGSNKPVLTFAQPALGSDRNTTISIASVSQAVAPSNYIVNLQVGTNTGIAVALSTTSGASVIVTGGGLGSAQYRVSWTDIGTERTVNGGDTFRVTGNGVPLTAGSYTFFLLWSDGSQIQTSTWTVPA
jgi:FlaG/FlaF family flagellin (archaellin)